MPRPFPGPHHRRHWLVCFLACLAVGGCARDKYRRAADREAYCLIDSRQTDPRWDIPSQAVEPARQSRMYLGAEQDCGPKPPDDLAAQCFMDAPNGIDNTGYYAHRPVRLNSENPIWVDHLPRNAEGKIQLTQTLAMDLALLHSRQYQTQFEDVYLSALALSGNRFEFATQWSGGVATNFSATGEDLGNSRRLDATVSRLGLARNLPGGGQFATDVLNSLVWDFGSNGFQSGSASLVSTFTQPLLRGAFRHVRLESLTQAERNLLFSVRDFARFRRTFYVDTVTAYLNLLTQVQALRNLRTNVDNLRQNLLEHEFYVQLEMVSQIQRDQVFQQYQNGRLALLSSEQNLTASLDAFKFRLGLPPWVPLEIDESLLDPFELVDPQLVELQDAAQELYERLLQYLPPTEASEEVLQEIFDQYAQLRERVAERLPEIEGDLVRWESRLEATDVEALSADDRLDIQQQGELAKRVRENLAETQTRIADRKRFNQQILSQLQKYRDPPAPVDVPPAPIPHDNGIPDAPPPDAAHLAAEAIALERLRNPKLLAWDAIMQGVGEQLREEIAELYVAQTQIRLFLIVIEPRRIDELSAITWAHQNRLDLMNSKATVMDAYRKVEVAADALQSDLSLNGSVALGSDPTKNNAFRFDANNHQYTAGVRFDGPLNRLNERNSYRTAQIAYQRASRDFLADKDQVSNEVRSVLRQLELARLNFQIARQQLVAATRQVDQAQIDLRRGAASGADSNLTLFLLQALQGMLDAKNNLIQNWISYRVQRMELFTALEMLYLDENGTWLNDQTGIDELEAFDFVDPEYFPPNWVQQTGDSAATDAQRDRDLDVNSETNDNTASTGDFVNSADPEESNEQPPMPLAGERLFEGIGAGRSPNWPRDLPLLELEAPAAVAPPELPLTIGLDARGGNQLQ